MITYGKLFGAAPAGLDEDRGDRETRKSVVSDFSDGRCFRRSLLFRDLRLEFHPEGVVRFPPVRSPFLAENAFNVLQEAFPGGSVLVGQDIFEERDYRAEPFLG